MNRNLYYAVPLPLSAPSLHSRMAGMSILRIPEGVSLDYATVRKLMLCRIPLHGLVSPAFLLRQNIDPFNLKHGMTSLEFMTEASSQLRPLQENDVLVTFAMRHLSVFNAMAIQNYFLPDIFARFNYMVDLKTALETCALFGNTRLRRITNLNQVARDLGFTGDLDNQLIRADALHHIFTWLNEHDPKIMSFLCAPRARRLNLQNGPYFVHIDEGRLCLIRVLSQSQDLRLVKAIKNDGNSLSLITINLDLAPLMAPPGILTPERQQELKFDLNAERARLENANLADLLPHDQLKALQRAAAGIADGATGSAAADASAAASAATAATAAAPAADDGGHDAGATDDGQGKTQAEADDVMLDGVQIDPQALYQAAAAFTDKDLPFYDLYFKKLAPYEKPVFERLMSHDIRLETNLSMVGNPYTRFAAQAMCYFNENFPGACFEAERDIYEEYCRNQFNRRAKSLMQECQMLFNTIDEKDTRSMVLLRRISEYF